MHQTARAGGTPRRHPAKRAGLALAVVAVPGVTPAHRPRLGAAGAGDQERGPVVDLETVAARPATVQHRQHHPDGRRYAPGAVAGAMAVGSQGGGRHGALSCLAGSSDAATTAAAASSEPSVAEASASRAL